MNLETWKALNTAALQSWLSSLIIWPNGSVHRYRSTNSQQKQSPVCWLSLFCPVVVFRTVRPDDQQVLEHGRTNGLTAILQGPNEGWNKLIALVKHAEIYRLFGFGKPFVREADEVYTKLAKIVTCFQTLRKRQQSKIKTLLWRLAPHIFWQTCTFTVPNSRNFLTDTALRPPTSNQNCIGNPTNMGVS